MALRYYSNTAIATTLAAPINNSDTSMTVTAASGFPGSFPYTLIVDFGLATSEVVEVSAAAGTTLTISRGIDNTSAQSHGLAAPVVHGMSKRDVSEPNSHIAATTNEHGLSGGAAFVGTTQSQTLTNKTMSGASNTFTALPAAQVTGNLSGVSSVTSSGAISGTTIAGTTITGTSLVQGTALIPTGLTGATTASRYVGGTAAVAPASGTFVAGDFVVVASGKIMVCTTGGSPGTWTNVGSLYMPLAGGAFSGAVTGTALTLSGALGTDSLAVTNASTGRNLTLTGTSDIVQLTVKGNGTQTTKLQEWKNSGNTVVASISNAGALAVADTTVTGGLTVTADLNVTGIGDRRGVVTAADELRTSTTTLTDTSLTLSVVANATYIFRIYAPYQAAGAGDLKYQLNSPAGSSMRHTSYGPAAGQSTNVVPPATQRANGGTSGGAGIVMGGNSSSGTASVMSIEGSLITVGTAGFLTLQIAQNTSNATSSSMKAGSFLEMTRVA